MSSMNPEEEDARLQYCREKNVHHLFELLASRLLGKRPKEMFDFLRNELTVIEEEEKRAHTYDPTQVRARGSICHEANPMLAGGGGHNKPSEEIIKITLGVFGLNNAGKTALLSAMGGDIETNTTPTIGFSPIQFTHGNYDICIFDLGGGPNFRGIWPHYFHDCHGLIYVVDSADEQHLAETKDVFRDVMQHQFIQGKPLLVFSNKKDIPTAQAVHEVESLLEVPSVVHPGTSYKVLASTAIQEDPVIDEGMEWMLKTVEAEYDVLSHMVAEHSAAVKEEKKRKLEAQKARVAAMKAGEV